MSKRARTLSPNSSEQGGEDQRSHSRNGQPSPPTSDDGEDEGGDDSSSDDEGVQRATQKRLNRQRDIVNVSRARRAQEMTTAEWVLQRPADYGVIESVTCFNFMVGLLELRIIVPI